MARGKCEDCNGHGFIVTKNNDRIVVERCLACGKFASDSEAVFQLIEFLHPRPSVKVRIQRGQTISGATKKPETSAIIKFSNFVRRQTWHSRFAHYEGSEQKLLDLVKTNWDCQKESGAGILVPVPPEGFHTPIIDICGEMLYATVECRQKDEESHICVHAEGDKSPAEIVDIILYHKDVLDQDNDRSTDADWEVISINAYPTKERAPMHPLTMARNYLGHEGGTDVEYSAGEFAQAIWYWSQHTNVSPS